MDKLTVAEKIGSTDRATSSDSTTKKTGSCGDVRIRRRPGLHLPPPAGPGRRELRPSSVSALEHRGKAQEASKSQPPTLPRNDSNIVIVDAISQSGPPYPCRPIDRSTAAPARLLSLLSLRLSVPSVSASLYVACINLHHSTRSVVGGQRVVELCRRCLEGLFVLSQTTPAPIHNKWTHSQNCDPSPATDSHMPVASATGPPGVPPDPPVPPVPPGLALSG